MPRKKKQPVVHQKEEQEELNHKRSYRSNLYSEEMVARICTLIATHPWGIRKLTREYHDLPDYKLIYDWRHKYPDFDKKYFHAMNARANLLAEEIIDIADDIETYTDHDGVKRVDTGVMKKAAARIAARQWTAAKLQPQIYADPKRLEELEQENASVKAELEDLRIKLKEQNMREY